MNKIVAGWLLILVFGLSEAWAQVPQVPQTIYFADMTLRLNAAARKEIQEYVDAQYSSQSHFQVKLDRVNLYMPVVERVLREEGVPEDFKFLVIQESSLIADAVSTSNAVGFWQFKKTSAEEVNLRVDREIDERKSIVAATRGAAAYLKKHYSYLNNWAITLVSYQMGLGGARNYYGGKYSGQRTMDIDRSTYWYLKKFLAHKIAYERQLNQMVSDGGYLHEYPVIGPTNLKKVASNLGVSEKHLIEYNKWAVRGTIPGDRTYVVTYILNGIVPERPVLADNSPVAKDEGLSPVKKNAQGYPQVTGNTNKARLPGQIRINGIKGILASGDSHSELAAQAEISVRKLRRTNDLKADDPIQTGKYYYTKRKKARAEVAEHIVQPGETLWGISQLYGIRLHSLMAKNRIYKDKQLLPGMVLRLRKYYKRNEPVSRVKLLPPAPKQATVKTRKPESPGNTRAPVRNTVLPENEAPEADSGPIFHQVQPGDTLYAISRKYMVSVQELKDWNNIGPDNILSVGQKLEIRKQIE
ncbi:membrane-bound lytic murein transglycosylase D [Cyclobacterium lianum]|uniref:Membrane-bound lytic murein transglycosylase D n=1 Tax=Cyclobacterium lianum TaxID=388280 RepID=A0A1M7N884_9BACT|nr:LysM peptidoglycan-binding domain-containing protein [Cyclobacterium lianum]SHM99800.1 membrane-bound lytic murein transglycosylase D [Cyclobacterium lianum]